MRYYDIKISDAGGNVTREYTSLVNGRTIAGALNVIIDVPTYEAALPAGNAFVQIWGTGLQDIGQQTDLTYKQISVFAGMQKGLPLANPAQAGVIAQGYINQAFGNWIGTEQTLDLVILAGTGPKAPTTNPQPKNLTLNWLAGQTLATAIQNALATAYPGFTVTVDISSNLVRNNNEVGFYNNVTQFAEYVKQASKAIIGGTTYRGVSIVFTGNSFNVFDGMGQASSPAPTQIAFQDLIGQPTWISPTEMQFKTVMRSDIKAGQPIKLPPTVVTNTQNPGSALVNQKATFQGGFKIQSLHHYGNFRQADAASWVTVFNAYSVNQVAA